MESFKRAEVPLTRAELRTASASQPTVAMSEPPRISVKSETVSGDALRHRSEVRNNKESSNQSSIETNESPWRVQSVSPRAEIRSAEIQNVDWKIDEVKGGVILTNKKIEDQNGQEFCKDKNYKQPPAKKEWQLSQKRKVIPVF